MNNYSNFNINEISGINKVAPIDSGDLEKIHKSITSIMAAIKINQTNIENNYYNHTNNIPSDISMNIDLYKKLEKLFTARENIIKMHKKTNEYNI